MRTSLLSGQILPAFEAAVRTAENIIVSGRGVIPTISIVSAIALELTGFAAIACLTCGHSNEAVCEEETFLIPPNFCVSRGQAFITIRRRYFPFDFLAIARVICPVSRYAILICSLSRGIFLVRRATLHLIICSRGTPTAIYVDDIAIT